MFKKILIANRGEIALRIIRSCKELNIGTVSIYSNTDANASWIRQADEAWPLNSDSLSDSYLNIDKIMEIALLSKADAIHPGYGFLSENYRLARACMENGIIFIGPSPDILQLAGDKTACQEFVSNLGIRVPAKITGTISQLLAKADRINYPVLVKAAYGGGGKGIRLVTNAVELVSALNTTSNEALKYFSDDRIYVEEYIANCHHIEIQIVGDTQGQIGHLFERECSFQRRHQKVMEEAPSVWLNESLRKELIDTALEIARAMKYTGAGTIEFLADDQNRFFFLEINPRIQVEHGITEMITGIDIVKEQINIAAGNPLTFDYKNIRYKGHAIEARICAEDPENDLLPFPGLIRSFSIPLQNGVRIDTAASENTMIPAEYDNLIGKVMVHGNSRDDAINKLRQVIKNAYITGIRHNLMLISQMINDGDFSAGDIRTDFLNNKMPLYLSQIAAIREKTGELAMPLAAALVILNKKAPMGQSPWQNGYWRNTRQIRLKNNDVLITMEYEHADNETTHFFVNDWKGIISDMKILEYEIHFAMDGIRHQFWYFNETCNRISLSDGHLEYAVDLFTSHAQYEFIAESEGQHTSHTIIAPQPGTVLDIKVKIGQHVVQGDNLVVIESMKLENTILAGSAGLVKDIIIKKGDRVKKNEPMIYLQ